MVTYLLGRDSGKRESFKEGIEEGRFQQLKTENERWEKNMRNPDWNGI